MATFEEDDALKFIRKHIEDNGGNSANVTDDQIIEVVDLSFDFYDDLADEDPFELTIDENGRLERDEHLKRLVDYISRQLTKSGNKLPYDIVELMTEGESLYEFTLDE